jgi:hypothetical protein
MSRKCIFTLTTGRTGTSFLAHLLHANLPNAEVHHEILDYGAFGTETPEVSHLRQFNAYGNTALVQSFWKQKFQRIAAKHAEIYAETSHVLAKAGLLENLPTLADGKQIFIVDLRRDILQTLCSFLARNDFTNRGNMWLWYLDPDYPRKLVDPQPLMEYGLAGIALWYICEMLTRAEYYRMLLADVPGLHFIDADLERLNNPGFVAELLAKIGHKVTADKVVIPPPQNQGPRLPPPTLARQLIENLHFDPHDVASKFFCRGRRLAETGSFPPNPNQVMMAR